MVMDLVMDLLMDTDTVTVTVTDMAMDMVMVTHMAAPTTAQSHPRRTRFTCSSWTHPPKPPGSSRSIFASAVLKPSSRSPLPKHGS